MQKDLLDAEMELFTKQHDGGPEIDQIQQKVKFFIAFLFEFSFVMKVYKMFCCSQFYINSFVTCRLTV